MKKFPTPLGTGVLIDPFYDPDKIGSIWMPPAAQNDTPSQGVVVSVGLSQTEIEVGFRVLVSTQRHDYSRVWYDKRHYEFFFYSDEEIVAFVTPDAEVFPRRDKVIIKPSWPREGVVQRKSLFVIDRVFEIPTSPRFGTVLRTGESVTSLQRGDTVILPRTGGDELGVKDRVLYSIKETEIMGKLVNAVQNDTHRSDRPRRKAARGPR